MMKDHAILLWHWPCNDRRYVNRHSERGIVIHSVGINPSSSHQSGIPLHLAQARTDSADLAADQIENWDRLQGSPSFSRYQTLNVHNPDHSCHKRYAADKRQAAS